MNSTARRSITSRRRRAGMMVRSSRSTSSTDANSSSPTRTSVIWSPSSSIETPNGRPKESKVSATHTKRGRMHRVSCAQRTAVSTADRVLVTGNGAHTCPRALRMHANERGRRGRGDRVRAALAARSGVLVPVDGFSGAIEASMPLGGFPPRRRCSEKGREDHPVHVAFATIPRPVPGVACAGRTRAGEYSRSCPATQRTMSRSSLIKRSKSSASSANAAETR
jgi:hypothetical protein